VPEFRIEVPQLLLDDLAERLARTRFPDPATEPGWAQGPPVEWMRELVDHWRTAYDWRAREARLNRHPQVKVPVDGLGIHAVHLAQSDRCAPAVLLTHGWPGMFTEYLAVAELLAADGYAVVVPSLPGYGFSDKPAERGWGVERVADAWVALMRELGHDRFVAVGSDWGTSVSAEIGRRHPESVEALVLVPPLAPPDPATAGAETTAEARARAALAERQRDGSAYSEIHETRPQTLGYSLADSPVGLAAWLLEKFWSWVEDPAVLDRDELLDVVMIYWLTNTGTSSARLYLESIEDVSGYFTAATPEPIDVPVVGVMFPAEVPWVSRRWAARRFPRIVDWIEPQRGGHCPGLEHPEAVADAVRRVFRS
jgi:pimeloyl-ACP methyl ester carboxylesterase